MGDRGGLREIWSDLLECCTPMQEGDLDGKLRGSPDRPNAFSFEQPRPSEDLRMAAWGEKLPDNMLRTDINSHRAPEVAQASWDMASHVSPQELDRSMPSSKGGRPESPFVQTFNHQGNAGGAVHFNDSPSYRATGAAPGGPRQVAFCLTRDDRPDAAPVPNQVCVCV